MRMKVAVLVAGILAAVPMAAHHSFAAEFDSSKRVTIKGTVTKLEWINPHAHFYVDVKDESGKVTNWELELGSPNSLMRQGWNRNSLKPGDLITVQAFVAKDGANLANANEVVLANGQKVFGGSAYSETEKDK